MNRILDQLKKEGKLLLSGLGLKTESPTAIGIDFGSKYFRAVRIKRIKEGFTILDTCIDKIDQFKNIQRIMHIEDDEAVSVNFGGESLAIRRVSLPVMPYEEIENALKWELKEQVSFDIERAKIKFSILEEKEVEDGTKKIELIAVAYREDAVENRVKGLKSLNLNIQSVMPSNFALAKYIYFSNLVPPQEKVLIADIGSIKTAISIVENGKIYFARDIAIGGDTITEAMVGALVSDKGRIELTREKAERIKCEDGISEDMKVFSMMRPVLERLSSQIKSSLEYCESQFKCTAIKKVILAGNGAKLKALKEYLTDNIGVEVITILPEVACAVGLALGRDSEPNMLPIKFKIEKKKALEKISIRMLSILLGLIFLFSYGLLCIKAVNLKKELEIQRFHWGTIKELKIIKDKIEIYSSTLNIMCYDSIKAGKIMKELSNLSMPHLMLKNFIINNTEPNIELKGIILKKETLSEFMSNLEASSLFENVKLVSSEKDQSYGAGAMDFEIGCNVTK